MDIHKPKAAHGWRDFASEIGTIVLGVLVALVLEQAVQTFREHRASAEARENVRLEIARNLAELKTRVDIQACLDRHLGEIGDLLVRTGEGELKPQASWIGRPPFWSFPSGAWQAATGGGRTALLTRDEQLRLGGYYARFELIEREEEREQIAWAHLRGLETWRGPLGPFGHFGFTQALQDARYSAYRIHSAPSTCSTARTPRQSRPPSSRFSTRPASACRSLSPEMPPGASTPPPPQWAGEDPRTRSEERALKRPGSALRPSTEGPLFSRDPRARFDPERPLEPGRRSGGSGPSLAPNLARLTATSHWDTLRHSGRGRHG
ncbi:MAG TPA: hypothetical protein VII73_01975 [Caulobacteraceae bacterium]